MKKSSIAMLLTVVLLLGAALAPAQIQSTRDATQAFLKETTFLASAARTTSGDSGTPVDLAAYNYGNIYIDVTAASGTTPTLDVSFQSCSGPAAADCTSYSHTAATQITTTGRQLVKVTNFGRYGRISFTIGGTTPSFTFSVTGAFKPN